MKKILPLLFLFLAFSCGGRKTEPASAPTSDTTVVAVQEEEKDTTLYGRASEFGMSTFSLITDSGDTLFLTRTRLDGTEGEIYGSLREGDRYAMTTRDEGEAIGVLINLTQLDKHLKSYNIRNGHLLKDGDTLRIESLSDKTFKTK